MKTIDFFSLFVAAILILSFSISGEVRVKEIAIKIPTYYVGPDDPSPPFWNLKDTRVIFPPANYTYGGRGKK